MLVGVAAIYAFVGGVWSDAGSVGDTRDAPSPAVAEDSARTGPAAAGLSENAEINASDDDPLPTGLRGRLVALGDGGRNQLLRFAIIDAGLPCMEIVAATALGDLGMAWRVRCEGTTVYSVAIDELDRFTVSPTPYGDFEFGAPVRIFEGGPTQAPSEP